MNIEKMKELIEEYDRLDKCIEGIEASIDEGFNVTFISWSGTEMRIKYNELDMLLDTLKKNKEKIEKEMNFN